MSMVVRLKNEWAWLSREHWEGAQGGMGGMMAEINALPQVLRTLSADEVLIRGMSLMNDLPMHESAWFVRRFDANAVAQTVPMVAGKPVLVNHTTDGMDGLPVGRFFRASIEQRADGSTRMNALFFMLKDHQGTRIANAIDGGLIAENSPTLMFDRVYCSICGANDMNCDHVSGELYDGLKCYAVMTDVSEFLEGSLVWAGQQRDTSFYVAAGRDVSDADEYFAALAKRRGETVGPVAESAPPTYWSTGWWSSSTGDGSPGT